MKVLCTGPESSGTRLLTRLVGDLGVESIHRSVPHAKKWIDWPVVDKIIIIVRDPFITELSAEEAGHPSYWDGIDSTFPYRITHAWELMVDKVAQTGVPWIPLTYEGLLARPQWTLDHVADFLAVPRRPVSIEVKDPRKDI